MCTYKVKLGVETLGQWGPCDVKLFKESSKWLIDGTGDRRAFSFLGQRINLAKYLERECCLRLRHHA